MRLKDKKLFLFDIDGTLAVENTLYEGSSDLLSHIASIGGKSYFITNNSTKSSMDYVEKFRLCFGLHTEPEQFITSGYMAVRFLKKEYAGQKIYCLGTSSFITQLRQNGLCVTEEADDDAACVLAAYDSELTYEKLVTACRVLSRPGLPFYATNPDLCCPASFGFIPDCGSICAMLTASTGKEPVYLGKPNADVARLCMESSGFSREETLVVGDRLYTDIACGINAGVETCVVFTGEAKPSDIAHTPYRPDYCFQSAAELLSRLLSFSTSR